MRTSVRDMFSTVLLVHTVAAWRERGDPFLHPSDRPIVPNGLLPLTVFYAGWCTWAIHNVKLRWISSRTPDCGARGTQPSTLRGMVKWVSAYQLSNNNKWRWCLRMVPASLSADSQPKSIGLVWGLAATRRSVCIHQMKGWTLAMTMSWWQHHKHCRGYYQ